MAQSHRAPPSQHRRSYGIADDACDRLRELNPDYNHLPLEDLGNRLDVALHYAYAGGDVEMLYRESRPDQFDAFDLAHLTEGLLGAGAIPLDYYGVVVPSHEDDGPHALVLRTLLTPEDREENIESGRWLTPAAPEEDSMAVNGGGFEPVLVAHPMANGEDEERCFVAYSEGDLREHVITLLRTGVKEQDITIWRGPAMRLKLTVGFE